MFPTRQTPQTVKIETGSIQEEQEIGEPSTNENTNNTNHDSFLIRIDSYDSSNRPYDDEPLPSYTASTQQQTPLITNDVSSKRNKWTKVSRVVILISIFSLIPMLIVISKI
ncbi:3246_t:CDS:2, partial [Ambispora gerdemannii]